MDELAPLPLQAFALVLIVVHPATVAVSAARDAIALLLDTLWALIATGSVRALFVDEVRSRPFAVAGDNGACSQPRPPAGTQRSGT